MQREPLCEELSGLVSILMLRGGFARIVALVAVLRRPLLPRDRAATR